jgi:predicted type IV restriction endonuclease
MADDLEARLAALAERTMRIRAHCAGEDATRIYLVMPFLELLGYDAGDPSVIVPEHEDGINFAVLVDGRPTIAIEATGTARPPSQAHGRLRRYCEMVGTIKLGIATNGVCFEVFNDTQAANQLDDEPFLHLDMAAIAGGEIDAEQLEFLRLMSARTFSPERLAEHAFTLALRDRLKSSLLSEFRNPSEALCRLLLEQIGVRNAKPAVIEQHYRPIVKTAMEQAIIVPVLQALRQLSAVAREPAAIAAPAVAVTPVRDSHPPRETLRSRVGDEVAAFGRIKRRSA